ncbi:Spo0B domain-containing protein [Anaerobacillus sp. HL2]|nr:Spo0B domain-containing protein [Anaerobacillus sp. HL2]
MEHFTNTSRHSRHDWLNFVQLIKGNLTLKNDRIEEIIQEVITKPTMKVSCQI